MRLHVILSLLFVGINAQKVDDALKRIFGNGSDYIPPDYEEVSKPPLEDLSALSRCGDDTQRGKKVCIVYHRCDADTNTVTPEEVVNTSGEGIIDIRENTGECEHYMDVCCNLPEGGVLPPTTPRPPPTETPLPPKQSFCGIRNEKGLDFKIAGQTNEAENGEFPWMVALLETKDDPQLDKPVFLCGASLIAPSVVLTGAHCVHNYQSNLDQIKIRAGEWDTLSEKERLPYQERAIKQIIIHQQFNPKIVVNDIALLVLQRPLSQADNIGTICMAPNGYVSTSKDCFASGWGKKEFGNKSQYSAILKKLQLPMVPKDQCQANLRGTRLGLHFILDQSFVCAGGEATIDTCTGDGGSPLVCPDPNNPKRFVQVGIVAWGIGCGEPGVPGVYANVPHFRSWIDQQMSVLGFSTNPYIQ